jgi:hypothetical protein
MSIAIKTRKWGKELSASIGLNGVREGDEFIIEVFQERTKKFILNRTKYTLMTAPKFDVDYIQSKIVLPVYGMSDSKFEIELVMDGSSIVHNENSRYLIKSLSGSPFRINGNYSFEAYLERGDLIDIGFNQIRFLKTSTKEFGKKLPMPSENILKSTIPILLEGETGTGKTTMAREIHSESNRSGRFVHLVIIFTWVD